MIKRIDTDKLLVIALALSIIGFVLAGIRSPMALPLWLGFLLLMALTIFIIIIQEIMRRFP